MQRKNFVITGAGTGIGRATALTLAAKGHRLLLVGRNGVALEETRSILTDPDSHCTGAFDMRDRDAWRAFFANSGAGHVPLDGVFANAGAGGSNVYGNHDRWEEIISTNLTGTYTTIMECLPHLKNSASEYRHVVITSSCLARFGVAGYTAYCTSKTGLLGLTRALALELAPHRILVNALCPGWVETDMSRASITRLAGIDGTTYEQSLSTQMSMLPLGRMSSPDEIGSLVSFLFSGEQVSMTGQGIDINNGSFMI